MTLRICARHIGRGRIAREEALGFPGKRAAGSQQTLVLLLQRSANAAP